MDGLLNDSALLAVLSLLCRKLKKYEGFLPWNTLFMPDFVRNVLFRSYRQYGDTKSLCFLPYVRRAG
jgi:hypothetical protein